MLSMKKSQNGFSAVELLIIIVILAVIGVAGFYVVKHNKKTTSSNIATTLTNQYSGWKGNCDSATKICFQYPTNWTLHNLGTTNTGTASIILDSVSTINITFANVPTVSTQGSQTEDTSNPITGAGAGDSSTTIDTTNPVSFKVLSINNLYNTSSNYKVVGGYVVSSTDNIPSYFVTKTNTIDSDKLQVGQTTTVLIPLDFVSPTQSANSVLFGAGPIATTAYSTTQATDWFTSSAAKTSLLILESMSVQ